MPKHGLNLYLSEEVMLALSEKSARTGVSKSAWAEQALRAALLGQDVKVRGDKVGTSGQTAKQAEVSAQISNTLDRKLMEMVERKPELLNSLDDKTIAQLLVARAPKPRDGDIELELSYLSLTESLSRLPEVGDLEKDLRRAKLKIEAMQCESETMREMLEVMARKEWRDEGFDFGTWRKVMNDWQDKVMTIAKRGGDVYGVELPDFHCCLVNRRRFDLEGKPVGVSAETGT